VPRENQSGETPSDRVTPIITQNLHEVVSELWSLSHRRGCVRRDGAAARCPSRFM